LSWVTSAGWRIVEQALQGSDIGLGQMLPDSVVKRYCFRGSGFAHVSCIKLLAGRNQAGGPDNAAATED